MWHLSKSQIWAEAFAPSSDTTWGKKLRLRREPEGRSDVFRVGIPVRRRSSSSSAATTPPQGYPSFPRARGFHRVCSEVEDIEAHPAVCKSVRSMVISPPPARDDPHGDRGLPNAGAPEASDELFEEKGDTFQDKVGDGMYLAKSVSIWYGMAIAFPI
jgi:hypothetical protein